MALQFGTIATIVTGLVDGAKLLSTHFPASEAGTGKSSGAADVLATVEPRLEAMAVHEGEQDALLKGLAEQLENVAAASQQLDRRVFRLTLLAAAALVVGLGTLLLVMVRG